jgi:hypothetical protein
MQDPTPSQEPASTLTETGKPSGSAAMVAIAWLVVAVPLGWGVTQTVIKSLDLFRAPAAQAVAPTTNPTLSR